MGAGVRTDDWNRLKSIVSDALEQASSERAWFLSRACAGDADLHAEATALVEIGDALDDGFVLDRRADAFAGVRGADPSSFAGSRFGAYELRRLIGQGASGAVYRARQAGVDRDVALKVFAPQSVGFDARLRFEREVRALGRVSHPGVARIYDAGLHADPSRPDAMPVPYIAMELVEGVSLTAHAARCRLGLRGRLTLIADVGEAVHAAHQRAVIHRDLKPANILVGSANDAHPFGTVKVLDFGIARVLHEREDEDDAFDRSGAWSETLRTTGGLLLGSLAYMSPEQARGEADAVDVRTDVYALGVMLYELLFGEPPVPVESLALTESLRRLSDPDVRIGRIEGDFTGGDLATVLRAALAPERERRYASAEAFAEDVRRLLRREAISARPATRAYRVRSFVRRHRVGVAAGGVVALALVAGSAVAAVGLVREREARVRADAALVEADRQRGEAESARRRVEASRDFLAQIIASADPAAFGRDATVIEAVRAALPMLDAMDAGSPADASVLRRTVAQTFRSLGALEDADAAFQSAQDLAAIAWGEGSHERVSLALEHAELMMVMGRLEEARVTVERASDVIDAMPMGDERARLELVLRIARAGLLFEEGFYEEASALYASALEAAEGSAGLLDADDIDTLRGHYGLALSYAGRLEDAEGVQRAHAEARRARWGEDHPRTLAARQQWVGTLTDLGRLDEAEAVARQVVERGSPIWGELHHFTLSARHSLATIALTRGDGALAAAIAEEILRDGAGLREGDAGVVLFLVANTRAVGLATAELWDEAIPAMREVVSIAESVFGPDHRAALVSRASLANMLGQRGELDLAIGELGDLLEAHELARGADSEDAMITRNNLGMLHVQAGRPAMGEALIRASLEAAERAGRAPMIPLFRRNLGRALLAQERFDESERELLAALREGEGLLDESQQARTRGFLDEVERARETRENQ